MAHSRFFTILTAVAALGAHASPCKPPHGSSNSLSSTSSLSTDVVTYSAVSSTTKADTTDTVSATSTSATETASTESTSASSTSPTITETASETSSTPEASSTTSTTITTDVTESASATSSTPEVPTPTPTTSEPPCVETQILVNPAFDDNDDAQPWSLGAGVSVSQINPRSAPNFLYNTLNQGRLATAFQQRLPALGSFTYELNYFVNLQTAVNGRGFSCRATPSIGDQVLAPSVTLTDNGPYGFRSSSQAFTAQIQDSPVALTVAITCEGSFNVVIIGVDDFSLTRLCGAT
ncbi:hypothetical protein Micbo1qcDRAFT_206645 [Microdochium bolleyi]|uniref:Ubiquitin 3 binding protein But2 C-terminal domain-containing protein n=1 Tax=Microdochium bolleyi TaxID=196109 RepID=A0A136IW05_9PEZI|nr:hypothetical protein Micbo1qcDRAFT_206645 [Microdochium bolleyi]